MKRLTDSEALAESIEAARREERGLPVLPPCGVESPAGGYFCSRPRHGNNEEHIAVAPAHAVVIGRWWNQ